jgi:hypothetical protein
MTAALGRMSYSRASDRGHSVAARHCCESHPGAERVA